MKLAISALLWGGMGATREMKTRTFSRARDSPITLQNSNKCQNFNLWLGSHSGMYVGIKRNTTEFISISVSDWLQKLCGLCQKSYQDNKCAFTYIPMWASHPNRTQAKPCASVFFLPNDPQGHALGQGDRLLGDHERLLRDELVGDWLIAESPCQLRPTRFPIRIGQGSEKIP